MTKDNSIHLVVAGALHGAVNLIITPYTPDEIGDEVVEPEISVNIEPVPPLDEHGPWQTVFELNLSEAAALVAALTTMIARLSQPEH